ncbi:glycosyltransferase [Planococcus kocurii]|uniref:glycosyltransferase n=1 Tax=Planococcus kocurii TaxID=1374 RepID=UPI003D04F879
MKAVHVNAVSGIRSTGHFCLEISNYINSGSDVSYIAYAEGENYENEYIIGNRIDRKMHALASRAFGKQSYFSKNSTKEFLGFLEEIEPDIIHLHNLHSNYINLDLLLNYIAKKDIATVLTLHDCWFFTGKCTHYTVSNCKKWIDGCHNCPRLKKDNPSWFFDCTPKMYQDKKKWFNNIPRLAVVGVSDWITREAQKSFLSSSAIITRIHNWVDLEIFKPVDTTQLTISLALQNKFVILGVASIWSDEKGIEKFKELSYILPDNIVIILVGTIPSNFDIPKNIISIPETHNTLELVKYYSLADVLVNLSLEETFGMVTAEALSCGTPAIVFNSTANPELIGQGCGYIVDIEDSNGIKESIQKVYNNGKEYYSTSARSFAQKYFSKVERMEEYQELYQEIVRKGRKD